MHETYASTINTLTPWLISRAKNNNLNLITVGELGTIWPLMNYFADAFVAECLGDTTSAYRNGTANRVSSC
jgi:hypothetical protein